jgi:hypothetical protein
VAPAPGSAAQDATAAQDPLGDRGQLGDACDLRRVELAAQGRVGQLADLAAAPAQLFHVLAVARVLEGSAQLDQQRFDPDSKLKRGLAVEARLEV